VSRHGPTFYRLPPNEERITLRKGEVVPYPSKIDTGDGPNITVFDPGFPLHWRVEA
jgi:dihydroorotase